MTIIRATAKLKPVSGIVADEVNNVWHFNATDGFEAATEGAVLGNAFQEFYGDILTYLSATILRAGGHEVTYAEVTPGVPGPSDDIVGVPISSSTFSLGAGTVPEPGTALPSEVAACMSMRGDYSGLQEEAGLTRPRSRVRGRVYLGPLNTNAISRDAETYRAYVGNTFRTVATNSYLNSFIPTTLLAAGLTHVIYSPTSGTFAPVTEVWMDDAFDIIRSRGEAATSRISVAVPPG